MPRFMLDTDTCSYVMKRSHQHVVDRLQSTAVGDACISVITRAELIYGMEASPKRANDLFIAGHARALGLTLVTNNTAEFGRVQNLSLENWADPSADGERSRTRKRR